MLARTTRIGRAQFDAAVEATATTPPRGHPREAIDAARALLQRDGEALLGPVIEAVATARTRLSTIPGLIVLDGPTVDPTRPVLALPAPAPDGNEVEQDPLARGMPVEMADRDTIVAMVTMADRPEAIDELAGALAESIHTRRSVASGTGRRVGGVGGVTGDGDEPSRGVLRRPRERPGGAGGRAGERRAHRALPARHPRARTRRGGHRRGRRSPEGGTGRRQPDRLRR